MLSKPVKTKKSVKILKDLDIEKVSLVSHAANQTPFRFVKSAEDVQVLEAEPLLPVNGARAIERIIFKKENYTEQTVKDYLKKLNVEDYNIDNTPDFYIVKSRYTDNLQNNLKEIELRDNITISVGVYDNGLPILKSEEDNSILQSKKAIEKFDVWAASYSLSPSLGAAVAAGMWDGIPPGFNELAAAYMGVVMTATYENNLDIIPKAAQELGEAMKSIAEIFQKLTQSSDMELYTMSEEQKPELENAEPKPVEEPKKEETAPAQEGGSEAKPSTQEAAPQVEPKVEVNVEQPVEKADAQADLLKSISALMDAKFATFETAFEEKLTKSAQRIESLEQRSAQPKSVGSFDEEKPKEKKEESKQEDASGTFKAHKGIWGIY